MARIVTTIDKTGPVFTGDPTKTFEQNARRMFEAMAVAGEREAKLLAEPFVYSGAFFRGIRGRTTRLDGKPFKYPSMTVSELHVYPWKGKGTRGFTADSAQRVGYAQYRGGKLERTRHIFSRSRSRLARTSALNAAELMKGLE